MSISRSDVVAAATAWLGTPYRHQASTIGVGCDCLGLLRGVWRALHGNEPIALPPYRPDWRDMRFAEELQDAAWLWLVAAEPGPVRSGQVVLFRLHGLPLPKHCGIVVDSRRFIHARERLGVVETTLDAAWTRRVAGQFDFPQVEEE